MLRLAIVRRRGGKDIGMKEWHSPLLEEYSQAAKLLEAMENLHRMWAPMRPPPPLKRSDMMVLATLAEMEKKGGPVTASRLARSMKQSLPGISQKLSMLENEGFLRRSVSESDRRVVCLEMTAQGKKKAETALRVFLRRMERATDILGQQKASQLATLLGELGEAIEQSKGEESEC